MTPEQFENNLFIKRAELLDKFKSDDIKDLDVYIKSVMDYQETIARSIVDQINNAKAGILQDNRERFQLIMDKISKLED